MRLACDSSRHGDRSQRNREKKACTLFSRRSLAKLLGKLVSAVQRALVDGVPEVERNDAIPSCIRVASVHVCGRNASLPPRVAHCSTFGRGSIRLRAKRQFFMEIFLFESYSFSVIK